MEDDLIKILWLTLMFLCCAACILLVFGSADCRENRKSGGNTDG